MASIQCPKCKQRYALKDQLVGKRLKCQKCGQAFQVVAPAQSPGMPAAAATPAGLPPIPDAASPSSLPPLPGTPAAAGAPGLADDGLPPMPLGSGLDDLLSESLPASPGVNPLSPLPAAAQAPLAPSPLQPSAAKKAPAKRPVQAKRGRSFWSSGELDDSDKQIAKTGGWLAAAGLAGMIFPLHRMRIKRIRIPASVAPYVSALFALAGAAMLLWGLRKKMIYGLPAGGGVLAIAIVVLVVGPYRGQDSTTADMEQALADALSAQAPANPDELEAVARDALAASTRLAEVLAGVRDAASLEAATPEAEKLVERLDDTMGRVGLAVLQRVQLKDPNSAQQWRQQMAQAAAKIGQEAKRIESMPGADDLFDTIDGMDEAIVQTADLLLTGVPGAPPAPAGVPGAPGTPAATPGYPGAPGAPPPSSS